MSAKRASLTTDDIKAISFEGLVSLTDKLEALGLTYYLAYGTLLGAVRHKGFIPWDDDIDIWVPRKDYDLLLNSPGIVGTSDWELLSYRTTPGYALAWSKYCHKKTVVIPSRFCSGLLYGCSIDIFPLDSLIGETEEEATLNGEAINATYRDSMRLYKPTGVLRPGTLNAVKRVLKRLRFVKTCAINGPWEERLRAVEQRIYPQREDSRFVAFTLAYKQCVWPRSCFEGDDPNYLEFEGVKMRVPTDCDGVLSRFYGNYMTPPPVSEQVTQHSYKGVYWRV